MTELLSTIQNIFADTTLKDPLNADENPDLMKKVSQNTGGITNLWTQLGDIIQIIIIVVGVALVIVIIYGGVLYLTAGGDEKKTGSAKKTITNGIIGIVLVFFAFAIANGITTVLRGGN
jgi:hypothetical protein